MNRALKIPIVFVLGLGLTLALLWLLGITTSSPTARAADLLHPAAAPGDVYCVTPESGSYVGCTQVFTNVQAAVDAASGGETIKVATGVYTDISAREGVTQVVYISKTVTIQGGYTTTNWTTPFPITQPTTLDAQGQGRVFYITGAVSPTLEGLRITGGDATGLGGESGSGFDAGGGIYILNAVATLRDNLISTNTAFYGGGLYLRGSSSALNGNSLTANTARGGGGLYMESSYATLYNNTMFSNTANGGGLRLARSQARLNRNFIASNTAPELGGGLYVDHQSNITLSQNAIISNSAGGCGGGLFLCEGQAALDSDLILSNVSHSSGGGLCIVQNYTATLTNVVVANNQIVGNSTDASGAGIYNFASLSRFLHATISSNTGGNGDGVYVDYDSYVALTNTILVSQTVGITATAGNTATLNGVLWYGNGANIGGAGTVTVTHEITGDPTFAPDGYHLTIRSAAIDQGVDAGVTTDIDSEPRPQGPAPDLGADEISLRYVYLPLVLR
jgi:hypothetical protein